MIKQKLLTCISCFKNINTLFLCLLLQYKLALVSILVCGWRGKERAEIVISAKTTSHSEFQLLWNFFLWLEEIFFLISFAPALTLLWMFLEYIILTSLKVKEYLLLYSFQKESQLRGFFLCG